MVGEHRLQLKDHAALPGRGAYRPLVHAVGSALGRCPDALSGMASGPRVVRPQDGTHMAARYPRRGGGADHKPRAHRAFLESARLIHVFEAPPLERTSELSLSSRRVTAAGR